MIILGSMIVVIFLLRLPGMGLIYCFLGSCLIILLRKLFNLRVLIYEDSGEVITIKLFHPINDELRSRVVEFPTSQLKSFKVDKLLRGYYFEITIKTFNRLDVRKVFTISCFEGVQIKKLVSSLEESKRKNNDS